MKKILSIITNTLVCIGIANAAVRDGTSISRAKSDRNTPPTQGRLTTTTQRATTGRTSILVPRSNTAPIQNAKKSVNSRTATNTVSRTNTPQRQSVTNRTTIQKNNRNNIVSARTASESGTTSGTRTGAEYEKCKNTYFSCMDQFCTLKNDDFRRCSCNDRVFDLIEQRDTLQDAHEQLTTFTENLDVIGMTAAQATALRTETEGENALTDDKSASKALLQAIMNSIRGTDTNVGGKFSDLNSIDLSFDTANAFGTSDAGQAISAYNGQALYQAVYPQCRSAVANDCNDASLQRAITAYLMAIEQDCNTVQTAINNTQKQLKSAVREGSAMLDLARIENRQKHNSSDVTTCINEVELAVLSEEVCGANYHKCLDNGEFIDVTTGKPISGVENFFELEKMLTFNTGVEAADQKLSQNMSNRTFVENFTSRVKKFAEPALDKCTEQADIVWSEYLDKALLDIYYAQKAKVAEIKQGCFDFVSSCYINSDKSITAAMSKLTTGNDTVVQPGKIALTNKMCTDYIASCNNMFDGNIVAEYIENQQQTDMLAACRAVVQQCFNEFGGSGYENFYYHPAGLFKRGQAADWFTLYDNKNNYVSECAKVLTNVNGCNSPEMIEAAFGGFDKHKLCYILDEQGDETNTNDKWIWSSECSQSTDSESESKDELFYGLINGNDINHRWLRPTGVATEIYNQILSTLTTQCLNVQGRFVEYQNIKRQFYKTPENKCIYTPTGIAGLKQYNIGTNNNDSPEDMCPRDYNTNVDTLSWGICSCWENGGRRSINGNSTKCEIKIAPTVKQNFNKQQSWMDAQLDTQTNRVYPKSLEGPSGDVPYGINGEQTE